MPRGVKGSGTPRQIKSLDERLAEIEATIETLTNQLSEAKAQRKILIAEKEKENATAIIKAMKKSGISTDELLDLIQGSK